MPSDSSFTLTSPTPSRGIGRQGGGGGGGGERRRVWDFLDVFVLPAFHLNAYAGNTPTKMTDTVQRGGCMHAVAAVELNDDEGGGRDGR